MATEPFLINPPKRLLARVMSKKHKEGTKVAKAKKRKAKRRGARKLPAGFGMKHRPVLYSTGPKRWARSPLSRSRHSGIHINPMLSVAGLNPKHRRKFGKRRRLNPVATLTGAPQQFMKAGPYMLTGGVSAIAVAATPGLTANFIGTSTIARYGSQLGITILGGVLVDKFIDRTHGMVWMVVGGSLILIEAVREFLFPNLPKLSDYTLGYELGNDTMQVPTFGGDGDEFMDAFPSNLGAFVDTPLQYQSY